MEKFPKLPAGYRIVPSVIGYYLCFYGSDAKLYPIKHIGDYPMIREDFINYCVAQWELYGHRISDMHKDKPLPEGAGVALAESYAHSRAWLELRKGEQGSVKP